jgi:hypothetical protein
MAERELTADEVADVVASVLDGVFSDPLNARMTAEVDGDRVMLMVYPFDEVTGTPSPKGQVFTVTVSDGYSMTFDESDYEDDGEDDGEDDDDDDVRIHASWGERF